MTETAEQTEATAATPETKGRPRPAEVVERDQKVIAYLREQKNEDGTFAGKTRTEVAEALGMGGNEVYLSFYRLKRDGHITRGGSGASQRWVAATTE